MRRGLTSFQDDMSSGVDGRRRGIFPLFIQHSRRGCWPWSLLCHHCDGWQSRRPVHWTTYHFMQRGIGLDVPFARSCFGTCWGQQHLRMGLHGSATSEGGARHAR